MKSDNALALAVEADRIYQAGFEAGVNATLEVFHNQLQRYIEGLAEDPSAQPCVHGLYPRSNALPSLVIAALGKSGPATGADILAAVRSKRANASYGAVYAALASLRDRGVLVRDGRKWVLQRPDRSAPTPTHEDGALISTCSDLQS